MAGDTEARTSPCFFVTWPGEHFGNHVTCRSDSIECHESIRHPTPNGLGNNAMRSKPSLKPTGARPTRQKSKRGGAVSDWRKMLDDQDLKSQEYYIAPYQEPSSPHLQLLGSRVLTLWLHLGYGRTCLIHAFGPQRSGDQIPVYAGTSSARREYCSTHCHLIACRTLSQNLLVSCDAQDEPHNTLRNRTKLLVTF